LAFVMFLRLLEPPMFPPILPISAAIPHMRSYRRRSASRRTRLLTAGQNQLIATLYVGSAQASGDEPDDLFKVTSVVNR
jgi:hypothetical protein